VEAVQRPDETSTPKPVQASTGVSILIDRADARTLADANAETGPAAVFREETLCEKHDR
jgi:hypothetical protein